MTTPPPFTAVLPVALQEPMGGMGAPGWRVAPDEGARLRLTLLLRSLLRHIRPEDLHELLLVGRPEETDEVEALVASVTSDARYRVVSEREVCPDLFRRRGLRRRRTAGWVVQQALKLAVADRVATPWYLTLDADLVCRKAVGSKELFPDGRALLNVETEADYRRLYTASRAAREVAVKTARLGRARRVLGIEPPAAAAGTFYGETPVLLHTDTVRELCGRIGKQARKRWVDALLAELPWTEYALYFAHLEASGEIDRLYRPADARTLLDLDLSVWHETAAYREPRPYDEAHFRSAGGCFLAVQSFLPATSWLPPAHADLASFYEALSRWVLT